MVTAGRPNDLSVLLKSQPTMYEVYRSVCDTLDALEVLVAMLCKFNYYYVD